MGLLIFLMKQPESRVCRSFFLFLALTLFDAFMETLSTMTEGERQLNFSLHLLIPFSDANINGFL